LADQPLNPKADDPGELLTGGYCPVGQRVLPRLQVGRFDPSNIDDTTLMEKAVEIEQRRRIRRNGLGAATGTTQGIKPRDGWRWQWQR
jgi:hypothetical protein